MMLISAKKMLPLVIALSLIGLASHKAQAAQMEKEPIPHIHKESIPEAKKRVMELREEILQNGAFVEEEDWEKISTPLFYDDKVSMSDDMMHNAIQKHIEELQTILNKAEKNKLDYEKKQKEEEEKRLAAKKAKKISASSSSSSGGSRMSGQSFKSAGVIYQNGRRFTYYSSRVLYHYRTKEWHAGSDGIYRTSDGYVVVAASDYPQGSIVDTPFGAGKVLDSGCAAGTTDIYVNF